MHLNNLNKTVYFYYNYYYNLSRDYVFKKYKVVIIFFEGNTRYNRIGFILF